jgi:hypothetical protein
MRIEEMIKLSKEMNELAFGNLEKEYEDGGFHEDKESDDLLEEDFDDEDFLETENY